MEQISCTLEITCTLKCSCMGDPSIRPSCTEFTQCLVRESFLSRMFSFPLCGTITMCTAEVWLKIGYMHDCVDMGNPSKLHC